MITPLQIGILSSGRGSSLNGLITAIKNKSSNIPNANEILISGTDRPEQFGISARRRQASNRNVHLVPEDCERRRQQSGKPKCEGYKLLPAAIALIISNKPDAPILVNARQHEIEAIYIDPKEKTREQHEQLITQEFQKRNVDLIFLVGYMRILSSTFINQWRNKILNIHPSLLPAFAGLMDLDVHRAVLTAKVKETGCTVHFVTEEDNVDGGPILLQKSCSVIPSDTPETLKAKVQALENEAIVEAVQKII